MSRFPPNQGFSVHDAINRSYDLAMRSLRNEMHALDISRHVAKYWYDFQQPTRWWRRPRTNQNPATKTDLAAYKLMEPFKKAWVEDDSRALPGDAVDRWVLEAMVEYALGHQPMYMGVMIGNVLFSYQNTQVQRVLARLDKRLVYTDAKWKDREFRRARRFIINNLKPKNGKTKHTVSQFLTLRETAHENEPKRFKVRDSSPVDVAFVKDTLNNLTPLDPGCPFPESFYNGELHVYDTDLESYIDPHLTPAAKGWVRKHVLLDPECWEPIYNQLGFGEPERKLEMPDHSSHPRLNPGNHTPPTERTPMNRSDMQLSPAMTEEIAKEAEDWNNQRRTFVASSIEVVINENRLTIPVNGSERQSRRFELEDGDSFIKLRGTNSEDSILLRTLFVSWDHNEVPDRPIRYVTTLAGGGKIKFIITYQKDEFKVPTSAKVDVTYIPKRDYPVWVLRFPKPATAYRILKFAVAPLFLITGAIWGASLWWSSHKQSADSASLGTTTSSAASNNNTRLPPVGSGGLSSIIPDGFRAMTVKVDDVVGVSGFIRPGTLVDVVVTIVPPDNSKQREKVSRIVLQNIKVLASGQNIDKPKNEREGERVRVVMLQVTPGQAEKLALASSEGKLQLVMRNSVDQSDETTPGANSPSALAGERAQPVYPRPKPGITPNAQALPPQRPAIEVIEGAKKKNVDFPKPRMQQQAQRRRRRMSRK